MEGFGLQHIGVFDFPDWLEEMREIISHHFFQRCKPIEGHDTLMWLRLYFVGVIEDMDQLFEQIHILRMQIPLKEVVCIHICFEWHFSEISIERMVSADFAIPDWIVWYIIHEIEVFSGRLQLATGYSL